MRCKKCGKLLPLLTKFCQKCGQPVDPEQRRKASNHWLIGLTIGLAVVSFLIYLLSLKLKDGEFDNQAYNALMLVLVISELFIIIMLPIILIKKLIDGLKFCFKHPKFLSIPLVIILAISGAGYFFYGNISDFFYGVFYGAGEDPVFLLQDNLTSAAAIKIYGDAVKAGSPANFTGKNEAAANAEQAIAQKIANLRVPAKFNDYKRVATVWPGKIRQAAGDLATWKDLPAQPDDFNLAISSAKAKNYLQSSFEQLALFKEFGDSALKRSDRETMAYLAAKLLVQDHWLNGLTHSNNSFSARMFAPALAYTSQAKKICCQVKGKEICADAVKQTISELYQSAYDYVINKDKTAAAWPKAWDKAIGDNGLPIEVSAVATSTKEQPKYSPTVQSFQDDCYAKGGSLNNTRPESDRLPTGESGYRCDYKSVALNCWDFLTYTGGSYSAGDDDCPEKNLIPEKIASSTKENNIQMSSLSSQWQKQQAAPPAKPKAAASTIKWDGTYPVTGSLKCTSQLPTFPPTIPIDETLKVANNSFSDEQGKKVSINSQGKASITMSGTQDLGSGVTMSMVSKVNYQFSKSGNVFKVVGTGTSDGAIVSQGISFPINCSGTVSGTKK